MKPHKLLALLSLLVAAGVAQASDVRLEGLWRSADAQNGALEGTIRLNKDGTATLAPNGQPEMVGTWESTENRRLVFEMPARGKASMEYRFDKAALILVYENGNHQRFTKVRKSK